MFEVEDVEEMKSMSLSIERGGGWRAGEAVGEA